MELEIKRLDHWGIVAGVAKDLKLADIVDQELGTNNQEILTTGDVVAGLVINGLAFASRPLMLAPQFFENKALELLIKPGVKAEHFNRHRIGRALDAIAEFGCEKLFNILAISACKTEGVSLRFGHSDTTSFSLYGQYEELDENGKPIEQKIAITYGYSKDKRPDLKQVVLEIVVSQDGGIPFMTKALSGNASDNVILRERAQALINEFKRSETRCLAADSKLYSEKTAAILNQINFITRVPATIKNEHTFVEQALEQQDAWKNLADGYKCQEFNTDFYSIKDQRWFVFHSQKAHSRVKKTMEKELIRERNLVEKELAKLQKGSFGCQEDALKQLNMLAKKWRYHAVLDKKFITEKNYKLRGRPTADTSHKESFKIQVTTNFDPKLFDKSLNQRSCFILATNDTLCAEDVLKAYKGQDLCEKGFAFLKKPEFFTSSLNLEKPGRIEAILTIMVLSLLVYSMAQRRLRKNLEALNDCMPNQLGKPTKRPTMRWIFQLFEGINFVIVKIDGVQKAFVEGLNALRKKAISLLGPGVLEIYSVAWSKG